MAHYRTRIGKNSDSWNGGAGVPGMQTGGDGTHISIGSADVQPRYVSPGGKVDVDVVIKESATYVGPGDEDLCGKVTTPTGLSVDVEVSIPELKRSNSSNICVPVWTSKAGSKRTTVSLDIPDDAVGSGEEKSFDVEVEAIMGSSGNKADSVTKSITVSSEGQDSPSCNKDSDCDPGMICSNGECVEDPSKGEGDDLMNWVINNPVKAGAGVLGAGIFVRVAF